MNSAELKQKRQKDGKTKSQKDKREVINGYGVVMGG